MREHPFSLYRVRRAKERFPDRRTKAAALRQFARGRLRAGNGVLLVPFTLEIGRALKRDMFQGLCGCTGVKPSS